VSRTAEPISRREDFFMVGPQGKNIVVRMLCQGWRGASAGQDERAVDIFERVIEPALDF
jgi:hypothetical protein